MTRTNPHAASTTTPLRHQNMSLTSETSPRHSRSHTSSQSPHPQAASGSLCGLSYISAGRIGFVSCLAASAVLLGYFAHDIISTAEFHLAHAHYDAIADRALDEAQAIALRKSLGTRSMASILRNRFPDEAQWPNVALEGYSEIARNLIATSDGRGMGFCPLVEPGQAALEFEAFAYDFFDQKYGNHTLGESSFGRGIYAEDANLNSTDNRFLDRDGRFWNSTLGGYDDEASPYRYLAPMLQHNNDNSPAVMRNIRNDRGRGRSIDRMMECVQRNHSDGHCGEISPFVLSGDGAPSAFLYEPILPVNSHKLTGFVVSSLRWSDTFTNIFTEQVSGIDLVVRIVGGEGEDNQGPQTYTYTVKNGNVTLVGPGDHHDPQYDHFQRTTSLTQQAFDHEHHANRNHHSYTLTLYPTDSLVRTFSTQNPTVAAVGVGCIIVLTSCLFFVFDCLVSRNIREKGSLLVAKREFMRYVCHEVRTPLNTVCMGLTLLQEDVTKAFADRGQESKSEVPRQPSHKALFLLDDATETTVLSESHSSQEQSQPQSVSLLQLSDEILTAANSAVGVLNDFLNYDKIETKSFDLDLSVLNIWRDLQQALLGFKLPAQAKNIDLQLDLSSLVEQPYKDEGDEEQAANGSVTNVSELPISILEKRVVGDDARLSQVFRNLISNSLKFTEQGGSIRVTAKWIPPPPPPPPPPQQAAFNFNFGDELSRSSKETTKDTTTTVLNLSNDQQVEGTPCGQIQISIQDTGAGMTQAQLDQVFCAGVQFNVNALQKGNGSGLGMYIAKEIVAQHGGSLVAESEGIGYGATFTMTLPLYEIPDEALPEGLQQKLRLVQPRTSMPSISIEANADPQVSETAAKPFEPLRVLVVDDAATNRKLLRRLLERRGHVCDEAKDGMEAILKVLGDPDEEKKEGDQPYFDTILLDYEMPVCNGPDCVAKLRKEGCDSFVVGITGNVLPEDICHFKASGANEVLHKPVDLDALGALWVEYGISGGGGSSTAKS